MVPLKPTYVNDAQGKPVAVVLDIRSYEQLLEELEDLEDVRDGKAILAAIAAGEEEVMTLEQATTALESDWAAPEQGSTPLQCRRRLRNSRGGRSTYIDGDFNPEAGLPSTWL